MSREMIKIVDLIQQITMGPFGSDITVDNFIDEGVPVLNGSNINGVKLTEETFRYVSKEKAILLKKANTKRGDIVITHRGTLGQIAYIPEDSKYDNYIISQSQFRVTLKTELVNPIYFTYYFHTSEGQKRLLSFKNHVGVPALAQATTNFRLLDFPYKPIQTQKKIAKVLSNLDAKIELNNKINAELEAMAKLIYDYWFVQFDFPDKNGKPYKTSGGLMVYNDELKREVPEGWRSSELNEICDIINGYAFKSEWYKEDGVKIIRTKNFENGYVNLNDINYLEKEFALEFEKYQLNQFEFLMVMVGASTGKNCIVNSNILPALQNQNMWRFVSKTNSQLYLNLKLRRIILELESTTNGSARGLIQKDTFLNKKVEIPSGSIVQEFCKKVGPIYQRIDNNLAENQKLAELRDWLLPMLMNGQVRVK